MVDVDTMQRLGKKKRCYQRLEAVCSCVMLATPKSSIHTCNEPLRSLKSMLTFCFTQDARRYVAKELLDQCVIDCVQ